MYMHQKMISLCDSTFERAGKMKNFSRWVRLQLEELIDNEEGLVWFRCTRCERRYERKKSTGFKIACAACAREGWAMPAMELLK